MGTVIETAIRMSRYTSCKSDLIKSIKLTIQELKILLYPTQFIKKTLQKIYIKDKLLWDFIPNLYRHLWVLSLSSVPRKNLYSTPPWCSLRPAIDGSGLNKVHGFLYVDRLLLDPHCFYERQGDILLPTDRIYANWNLTLFTRVYESKPFGWSSCSAENRTLDCIA